MTLTPDPSEKLAPRRLRAVEPTKPATTPRRPQQHPPQNLPIALSSFIGREREITELKRLVGETRLVTLTGPGGAGKTRLALAVAREVVGGFEEGAWWVGLAPLSDPDLVPQAVASAMGVREAPGRSLSEALVEDLKAKDLLLILDNCEHLIDACAALADALLRTCPGLKILATSREAFNIGGERAWVVPSLSLPDRRQGADIKEVGRYEAVGLFVERAKGAVSSFELTEENASAVAQLCRRLEGMPLAIELAAARARVLSVEQISKRLDESFRLLKTESRMADPRHQTLRATIDWSFELLSREERILFRRLSVFAGGFTLEAAEAVCAGEDIEGHEVLDLLSHLVDKSLVLVAGQQGGEEARYRLLETVRQYGQQRLEESGETDAVRRRHAAWFLALAEEAEPELREQGAWLLRLGSEHANFRAVLGWALDSKGAEEPAGGRARLGLRLAAALAQGRFWNAYGPSEGRRWLERGLSGSSAAPTPVRAKALKEAGWIATHQGDYEQAVALLEEGMALFKGLEDQPGVANSLFYLGHLALHGGNYERVRALGREAEPLRREMVDQQAIAHLLYLMGAAALCEGDHGRAITSFQESLALNREIGDSWDACVCLTFLGIVALEQDDPERAQALYGENMRLLQGLRDKTGIAYVLRGLACVASLRGAAARAARLWGAAEAVSRAIGLPLSPFDRSHPDYEGLLAAARTQLGQAAWEAAWSKGKAMTPEEAIEYALSEEEPAPPPALPPKETAGLSERELEVLRLVAEGLTDPQVAERLYLSPRTVGWHLRSIYRKLGVPSRAAAAKAAVERSLI